MSEKRIKEIRAKISDNNYKIQEHTVNSYLIDENKELRKELESLTPTWKAEPDPVYLKYIVLKRNKEISIGTLVGRLQDAWMKWAMKDPETLMKWADIEQDLFWSEIK